MFLNGFELFLTSLQLGHSGCVAERYLLWYKPSILHHQWSYRSRLQYDVEPLGCTPCRHRLNVHRSCRSQNSHAALVDISQRHLNTSQVSIITSLVTGVIMCECVCLYAVVTADSGSPGQGSLVSQCTLIHDPCWYSLYIDVSVRNGNGSKSNCSD